jgi:hypothetical protein
MEGNPRCKKCGRALKSPASIARGMGSKCAGVTATSGRKVLLKVRRSSGRAYPSVGMSGGQSLFFPGESPVKPLSKKEIYRERKEERRRSFETRQPFQCGLLLPKKMPLVYEPLEDGSWKENPSGRVIPHERLQQYLTKYRFI